jgi:hypothetical protein
MMLPIIAVFLFFKNVQRALFSKYLSVGNLLSVPKSVLKTLIIAKLLPNENLNSC